MFRNDALPPPLALIIEPSEQLRSRYERILAADSISFDAFPDVPSVLSSGRLETAKPAVVIAGLERIRPYLAQLTSTLRTVSPLSTLIGTVGFDGTDLALATLELGVSHVLVEPVSPTQLLYVVHSFFGRQELLRQHGALRRAAILDARLSELSRHVSSANCEEALLDVLSSHGQTDRAFWATIGPHGALELASRRGVSQEEAEQVLDPGTSDHDKAEDEDKPRRRFGRIAGLRRASAERRARPKEPFWIDLGEFARVALLPPSGPNGPSEDGEIDSVLRGELALLGEWTRSLLEHRNRLGVPVDNWRGRDALTGALTEPALIEHVRMLLEFGATTLSLIVVNLRGFRQVNDERGHEAGARLLVELARLILRCIRHEDRLARVAGDEFALLLPNVAPKQADMVAKRIQNAIEKHTFFMREQLDLHMSAFVGVSGIELAEGAPPYDTDARSLAALLDKAQAASRIPAPAATAVPPPSVTCINKV